MLAAAQTLMNFLSLEFTVFLTAAIPVVELRGAIPLGLSLGMSPLHAALISLAGSMLPVPFILFTIRPIFKYLRTTKLFRRLIGHLTDKSINNSGHKIQKYGAWGLVIFVAVPLPGTGVWSGSLAAALLDMRIKWAFPAILLGNIIAAVIVTCVSLGVINVLI
jgi:uncharacterized membrane protein